MKKIDNSLNMEYSAIMYTLWSKNEGYKKKTSKISCTYIFCYIMNEKLIIPFQNMYELARRIKKI